MEFKVGDKVKQIHTLFGDENPIVTITKITDDRIWHIHQGTLKEVNCSIGSFIKITEGSMDKYTELKQRIEGLKNGWDKEADEILQAVQGKQYIIIGYKSYLGITLDGDIDGKRQDFWWTDQCTKMDAFQSALLWLLDHSDIKKDEKQEKIEALKKQMDNIQKQIRELEVKQMDDIQKQIRKLEVK